MQILSVDIVFVSSIITQFPDNGCVSWKGREAEEVDGLVGVGKRGKQRPREREAETGESHEGLRAALT